MPPIIETRSLPKPLKSMFRYEKCSFWYDEEHRGPAGRCKRCYWGLKPDMAIVIKRKQVIVALAQVAEGLFAA